MPFQMETQRRDKWCWAAVSASVDHYFFPSSSSSQCQIAKQVIPSPDCCSDPDVCNTAESLRDALDVIHRLAQRFDFPVTFDDIIAEIDAERPVCARIAWRRGGAHFVAISGYDFSNSGRPLVDVSDPWFADSTMYYDDFVSSYQAGRNGGGEWTHTYYVKP